MRGQGTAKPSWVRAFLQLRRIQPRARVEGEVYRRGSGRLYRSHFQATTNSLSPPDLSAAQKIAQPMQDFAQSALRPVTRMVIALAHSMTSARLLISFLFWVGFTAYSAIQLIP